MCTFHYFNYYLPDFVTAVCLGFILGFSFLGICFNLNLMPFGEGNGNPLQRSCLENPRDGGAWWAAVYGVAQRRT